MEGKCNMKKFIIIIATFLALVLLLSLSVFSLSKIGSTGDEVTSIQSVLKDKGYYTGNIDGISSLESESMYREYVHAMTQFPDCHSMFRTKLTHSCRSILCHPTKKHPEVSPQDVRNLHILINMDILNLRIFAVATGSYRSESWSRFFRRAKK